MPVPVPPNLRNVPGSPNTKTAPGKKTSGGSAGHDIIVLTAVQLIGVSLMAILAGLNDHIGKLMVVLMIGFMFVWALTNATSLASIVNKTGL